MQKKQEHDNDDGAGLIGQAIPTVAETEPRLSICRCGHERDDHQSKTWQERGEKFYGQVCEYCPCKNYIEKGGRLDSLIESFRRVDGKASSSERA